MFHRNLFQLIHDGNGSTIWRKIATRRSKLSHICKVVYIEVILELSYCSSDRHSLIAYKIGTYRCNCTKKTYIIIEGPGCEWLRLVISDHKAYTSITTDVCLRHRHTHLKCWDFETSAQDRCFNFSLLHCIP